jgi:hypothetical protein
MFTGHRLHNLWPVWFISAVQRRQLMLDAIRYPVILVKGEDTRTSGV